MACEPEESIDLERMQERKENRSKLLESTNSSDWQLLQQIEMEKARMPYKDESHQ